MLLELHIENFAIIDTLQVQFSNGLNIVTGETGAGKSIMVDALMVALGGRASAEFIRTGVNKSVIEAVFSVKTLPDVKTRAVEYGFLESDSDENLLLIRREISRNGRNRTLVNGHPATNVMVTELGNLLVDIHGQHEHQSILNPSSHVDLLDSFGKLLNLRKQVTAAYRRFKTCERELEDLRNYSRERLQHLDMLRFQQQEIAKAQLKPGEEEELSNERKVLGGAEQLASGAGYIYDALYGEHGAMLEKMDEILRKLEDLADIDPSLAPQLENGKSTQYLLEDLAFAMRDYASSIEFNPYRLEEVEKRLDDIKKLKRKYGSTIEDILALQEQIEQELDAFDDREFQIEKLEKEYQSLRRDLQTISEELSQKRKQTAQQFEQQVMQELSVLSMEKTRFAVDFSRAGTEEAPFSAKGIDNVEFLIAPNVGEALKPLSKIASGGEISRVMLALKTLLGAVDSIPTMVFDEVDSGIGGKVAEIVGNKLRHIASFHQVVCITHLPQIASKGATHFHVEKQACEDRTITVIRHLSPQERLDEIARLLGGETITATTIQHAKEMLGDSSCR